MITLILACSIAVLSSLYAQPHPAGGAAFVAFRDRLYVQGGDLGGGNLVNQFYALDLSRSWQTDSPVWNTLPSGPINSYHSAGFLADMNSFVTFGRETGSPYTTANFINIFSTSTGSWIGTGSAMIADPTRRDMTIASDPSPGGQIYFMGGDAGQSGTGRSNVLDIYNLKSGVVSETNVPLPGPQNLQGGAATWLLNRNSMLIIGGLSDNAESNVVYLYTPGSGSSSGSYLSTPSSPSTTYSGTSNSNAPGSGSGGGWTSQTTTGYFPSLRTAHCVASNEDGSIVTVFGGFVNRSSTSDHSVYFLDTKTWSWTSSTSNSVRGRSYSACAFIGNQFIVWGGFYQNPTSSPNNLPSIEESTLVYSLDAQNWVSTFVPPNSVYGSGGANPNSGERGGDNNNGDLSNPKGKSVGLVLAIAAVGAILALVFTGGAIMVIRKRNQRRRGNNNNDNNNTGVRPTLSQNGVAPMMGSVIPPSPIKKTPLNAWNQKSQSALEAGLASNGGMNTMSSSGKGELGTKEDISPSSGYNTWEQQRGSAAGHRDEMGTTTSLMTNPIIGVTQTTIVTAPKNCLKPPMNKVSNYATTTRQIPEQDRPTFAPDGQPKDSWTERLQNQVYQPKLENEFEEKSQGAYYPISIEREYR